MRCSLLSTDETQLKQRTRTKHQLNTTAKTIHMALSSVLFKSFPVQRPTQIKHVQAIQDIHGTRTKVPCIEFTWNDYGRLLQSRYEHPAASWLAGRRITYALANCTYSKHKTASSVSPNQTHSHTQQIPAWFLQATQGYTQSLLTVSLAATHPPVLPFSAKRSQSYRTGLITVASQRSGTTHRAVAARLRYALNGRYTVSTIY